MKTYTRGDYIQLIEQTYFGNVVQVEINAVLACFTDNCLITIRHGDNPQRIFRQTPGPGETPLREFYAHLCGNFNTWFGDFIHYIDAEKARCACTFTVKLQPKQDSAYLSLGTQILNNCNFFRYQDDKIKEMTIYYSNTNETAANNAAPSSNPTGYPK